MNLSKSGASLSLGGKGATVNVSSRGVRTTYSIPGTGISYVSRTGSGKSSKSNSASNRSAYKELLRQQKEQEKQKLLHEAEEAYSLGQAKLESLSSILKNREKQPFDWKELTSPRGKYQPIIYTPPNFIEPQYIFSEEKAKQELTSKTSRAYITYSLIVLGLILAFVSVYITLVLFILALVNYLLEKKRLDSLYKNYLPRIEQESIEKHNQIKQEAYDEYLKNIQLERAEYALMEEEAKQIWEAEEKRCQRLRDAVSIEDPEPLTELLELELQNEDLPIPLVFDIEFVDVRTVNIFMELPELDVVPEEKLSLTKTGKLSTRKMAQKDRVKLYSDICTSLALRLIHETFRVIYSVNTVKLDGLTEKINPTNGNTENITSLRIEISRQDFEQLNLDNLDSTLAFKSLNGAFACSKNGELGVIQ